MKKYLIAILLIALAIGVSGCMNQATCDVQKNVSYDAGRRSEISSAMVEFNQALDEKQAQINNLTIKCQTQ